MKVDTFLFIRNKNFFYVLLIYTIIIILFFIGKDSLKKDEIVWYNNIAIINQDFVKKKKNCNNFLSYFNKKKIADKNTIFYLLSNFNSNLKKKKLIIDQFPKDKIYTAEEDLKGEFGVYSISNVSSKPYLQNLHSYLIQTLKINYYDISKNIVFISCVSKNEILLTRMWKNKKVDENLIISWKSK